MLFHDFFDFHTRERPDSEFAVMGDRTVTYGEANEQINRLANAFASAGIEKGDRIAILSKNSIEYMFLYYATSKAGVVPVPLNYRLAPPEWVYIINDSQAKMLVCSAEYQGPADGMKSELETVNQYVSIGGGDGSGGAGWTGYQDWVDGQPGTVLDRHISTNDDLLQMYTSGTTGRPKGVVLTHACQTVNLFQSAPVIDSGLERLLIVAPVYHAAAYFCALCCVFQGGCLFIHEDFDPVEVVRALDEEKISWALLVPAMVQACLVASPDAAEREFNYLDCIAYGGSAIAEETLKQAIEVFKCEFIQAFGMTELSPIATFLTADDHRRAMDGQPGLLLSAGRAVTGTDVRVVDEDDNPVPTGTMGEVVVRGPQIMKGYWNLPAETAEALHGGWMHTGDAGTLDEEGYLYIQDRIKDMIVSGGENIYPRMVEEVLFKHPAIADAAVFGVPDDQWGETVKAAVQLRQGASATEEELIEFCRDKMGGFERPRSVDFITALPRNASGKVLKRELREPYWKGQGRRIAGS